MICNSSASELDTIYHIKNQNTSVCYLCFNCITNCYQKISIIEKNKNNKEQSKLSFQEIFKKISDYIVGQNYVSERLAIELIAHYYRCEYNQKHGPFEQIQKNNILLIGNSGTGKTYIITTLCKLLDVPFVIIDATSLTETGYVGDDADKCIQILMDKYQGDKNKIERAVIFFDEIDKIAKVPNTNGRDISGAGVQNSLLTLMESKDVEVTNKSKKYSLGGKSEIINTKNMLFVFAGAFSNMKRMLERESLNLLGIEKIESQHNYVNKKNVFQYVTYEQLAKFGMVEEFLNRIGTVLVLNDLTKDNLKYIMYKTKNSIIEQQKNELYETTNINLEYNEEALNFLIDNSDSQKIGPRGLVKLIRPYIINIIKYKNHINYQQNNILYLKLIDNQVNVFTADEINIKDLLKSKSYLAKND